MRRPHFHVAAGTPRTPEITAREYPPTTHGRGYSPTREQAMAAFKAQWLS